MKVVILILVLILVAPMALAQENESHPWANKNPTEKTHPWAAPSDGRVHPMATPPETTPRICKDNVTCQIENLSILEFRNGALYSKPGFCTSCDQQQYNANVKWFLDHGYEIVETSFQGSLARIQLKYNPKK